MDNIELCKICNINRVNYYTRDFLFRDKIMCFDCFKSQNTSTPFFQNHIPSFCDGGTYTIFEFTTSEELMDYLSKKYIKDSLEDILVKSSDNSYLMTQNIKKSHWWVVGVVGNFDLTELAIPTCNYYIYNEDKSVNEEKLAKWLKTK